MEQQTFLKNVFIFLMNVSPDNLLSLKFRYQLPGPFFHRFKNGIK